MTLDHSIWLLAGIVYGFLIGIIPVAGATTGLIAVFSFVSVFVVDPYSLVVFTTAVVVSSSIGDSFSSVVLNIPGAGGSAATMVDGFPLAQQGQGARALSAAITTSTVNGLFWGILVFLFLPYYAKLVMSFGVAEIWAFMILAATSVIFINSRYWFRGILALALGIFLGLVGTDPQTNAARFTGGWFYLEAGLQLAPVMAGVLAFPELIQGWRQAHVNRVESMQTQGQIWQGMVDSWQHRWQGIRGGIIGAITGLIPGIGGNVADWMAYGQTVAANPREKIPFGQGNIKGVIGCEGANNSQKATSYVPTILFGIPGAPFEAVIMALFMYVGLEMGTPDVLTDMKFFQTLNVSYFLSMIVTAALAFWFIGMTARIMQINFRLWFPVIGALIVWTCVQYTGGWEDYMILALATIVGLLCKHFRFSRAALIIGFVLAERMEASTISFFTLYDVSSLLEKPLALLILTLAVAAAIYGLFFNRARIDYT